MDQGIGHHLANRNRRVQRNLRAEGLIDVLIPWQESIDVIHQAGKACGVAELDVVAMGDRIRPPTAAIGDETDSLPGQAMIKLIQPIGKENRAKISDTPSPANILDHQPLPGQVLQHGGRSGGQWLTRELKIALIIQPLQNFVSRDELSGNPAFPEVGPQPVPQCFQPVRVLGKFGSGAPNAKIRGAIELHLTIGGGGNFEQDHSPARMTHLLERDHDTGVQSLGEPEFQRVFLRFGRMRLKCGTHHLVIAIADAPQHVAEMLIREPGGVGERTNRSTDLGRVSVVYLELNEVRLGLQLSQVVD